ncbi:MAG: hypothetical protein ABI551_06390 [Polyangiaceae bacterium]
MLLVGVDENGLGPRLGPLIVTAVSARCTEAGAKAAKKAPAKAMKTRLGDSKDLVAHGNVSLGEAWARETLARTKNVTPTSPDDVLRAICIDSPEVLRVRCPPDHEAQCWGTKDESFTADAAMLAAVGSDLTKLALRGIEIARVEVAIVCTERINDAAARGLSRFHVDLHAMERLVLSAQTFANEPVEAICGKVGGMGMYGPHLGPLAGRLHTALEESRRRSAYMFPGVGTIAFVQDADATHLIVGMASLVGKWAREVLMARIVRHYRTHDPSLPHASGYHDPVTTRFVAATRLLRKKTKLPDDCFERKALGANSKYPVKKPAATSSPRTTAQASLLPKR